MKSKGLSDESIKPPSAPYNFLNPSLDYLGTKTRVRFSRNYLKQYKITYDHGKTVNIYIVYEINKNDNTSSDPTLQNCLFGSVSLTKIAKIERYKYSGYKNGFDRHRSYSPHSGGTGRIVIGVDMSSSAKIDNRKKNILILGKGPTQGLEHTLSTEKTYSINFTERNKNSEIVATPLCLGNISKN